MSAAVRLRDLKVAYRGHLAVHHLSGEFVAGRLAAVIGPNGAGKSTLMAAMAGTCRDFQGDLDCPPSAQVAYLPQAASLDRSVPVTVHEVVAMGLWPRLGSLRGLDDAGRTSIDRALAAVGLTGFERRLIGELSAGQAQRVLFARVLVQDARLVLLDEPFNAIDARTTADLLAVLQGWRREARTVIAVLHDLEQVREHFDDALLLAREAVAWGPVAQVLRAEHLSQARRMAEAWDADAAVCRRRT